MVQNSKASDKNHNEFLLKFNYTSYMFKFNNHNKNLINYF